MMIKWSPHPRYRLYTSKAAYQAAFRQLLHCVPDSVHAPARLEAEICRRFKVRSACCVPMARTGLFFALLELIKPGQKVILSPLTIVDVVNMVILAGGIPVFADIRRKSCSIDPEQTRSLVDSGTGAVLITHLHGESAGSYEFLEICRSRGIPLIEDAAQAFGVAENGRHLGTIGNLGIYSFGFYKNLNLWRGGMLVSQDEALIGRIRRRMEHLPALPPRQLLALALKGFLTDLATYPPVFANLVYPVIRYAFLHGIAAVNRALDPESTARRLSELPAEYLLPMSSAQAFAGLSLLDRIDADTEARLARATRYDSVLAPLGELITPRSNTDSNIYSYYPVQYRHREALLRYAMRHKRDFAAQHLRNCADLPEFHEYQRDCPNARATARELILLPTYPRYPILEVDKNIDVIQRFLSTIRS